MLHAMDLLCQIEFNRMLFVDNRFCDELLVLKLNRYAAARPPSPLEWE